MLVSHDFRLIGQVAQEIYEVNKVRTVNRFICLLVMPSLAGRMNIMAHPAQGVHRFEGDILAFKEHLRKTHAALAEK